MIPVDGYKRVRGLHKLGQDPVRATRWDLPEPEGAAARRLMRAAEGERALEQVLSLVRELQERATRSKIWPAACGRSPSWVESPARPGRDAGRSNPAAGARRKAVPGTPP
ncbi:MAG: hypothetical protein IPI67_31135 [Myxococcales bacterium]|nr:hypothetical protein [Myxococcales bacterium]